MVKLIEDLKIGHAVNKKGYFDSYKGNIFNGEITSVH